MNFENFDPLDPDRHLKRLSRIIGISARIQSLASRKRKSVKLETEEERVAKVLVS